MGINDALWGKSLMNDPNAGLYGNMRNVLEKDYAGDIRNPGFESWLRKAYNAPGTFEKFARLYSGASDQAPAQMQAPTPTPQQSDQVQPTGSVLDNSTRELGSIAGNIDKGMGQMQGLSDYANSQYFDTMKRLMEREDRYGSGNPFIDMLEAYTNYRKKGDPNYEFKGLMGMFNRGQQPEQQMAPNGFSTVPNNVNGNAGVMNNSEWGSRPNQFFPGY